MNLFVLDLNPVKAARAHCDKHVVKMVVETAQLLSTAHAETGSTAEGLYRPTHRNHPCAVWVRESAANYRWALALLEGLLNEYQRRYGDASGKRHATWRMLPALAVCPALPELGLTPFAQAMPEAHRSDDPVASYRSYYRAEKARFATYRLGDVPSWLSTHQGDTHA